MRRQPSQSLTLPFALLGLAGGWLAELVFHAWPLLVATPLCAALLGSLVRPHARGWLPTTTGATLLAGVINGVLCLLLIAAGGLDLSAVHYLPAAAYMGLSCSLPFIPATLAIAFTQRRAGQARPGSLIAGVERRAVWRATATCVALGGAGATILLNGPLGSPRPASLTLAAMLVVLLLLAADGHALSRLGRCARRAGRQGDPDRLGCAPVIDLGLGEQLLEEIAPARGPYREADRVVAIVRGNPAQARAALEARLRSGAFALALCVAAFTCQIVQAGRMGRF